MGARRQHMPKNKERRRGGAMQNPESYLANFAEVHGVKGKGPLSVVLTLTRNAAKASFPLSPDSFRTGKKGQVAGLGGPVVKSILSEYGIERILAEEGGAPAVEAWG